MKGVCATALVVLAGCGGSDGSTSATTDRGGTLPAARFYVAVGVTNSYVGPRRTVIVARGTDVLDPPKHGDSVIEVDPADAKRLFGLVEGSRRIATPQTPENCADCGTKFAEADGAYFTPSAEFSAEFTRLERAAQRAP